MSQQTLLIHGQKKETAQPPLPDYLQGKVSVTEFTLNRTRDAGAPLPVEARADDVLELQLQGGQRVWMTVADYRQALAKGELAGLAEKKELEVVPTLESRGATRGLVKWVVVGLRLIGLDLPGKCAGLIASRIDDKKQLGLFGCPLSGDAPQLTNVPVPRTDEPLLVLIHGTLSSTAGGFGELWKTRKESLQRLSRFYGDRSFALEHKTLTETPIDNALQLAEALPANARLHLVSHSRGGLVGELLCRGSRLDGNGQPADPFEDIDFNLLKDDASQLGKLKRLNDVLKEKRFRVERFVRVACPARGTSLASDRPERLLSLLVTPFMADSSPLDLSFLGLGEDVVWLISTIVKERTNPEAIPGVAAQRPDSPLVSLLNRATVKVDTDLRVIGSDYRSDGILMPLADGASEALFGGENDLVVNTPSMYGGAERAGKAWYYLAKEPGTWHCNYFGRQETTGMLVDGLLNNDAALSAFKDLTQAPDRNAYIARGAAADMGLPERELLTLRPPRAEGSKPLLVLMPGIMGSELNLGQFRAWVDVPLLLAGKFSSFSLDNGAKNITPKALMDMSYGPIFDYLSQTHEVLPFPYDWRQSFDQEGKRLADYLAQQVLPAALKNKRPVRILAHSMGGLLVRRAIAFSEDAADPAQQWWERLKSLPTSRFVMSGTPNRGSWLLPYVLAGRENLVKTLAGADLAHSLEETLETIATFDGFLEMMPDEAGVDYFDPATWQTLHSWDGSGPNWPLPLDKRLSRCRQVRERIDQVTFDGNFMAYIAGHARVTPTQPRQGEGPRLEFTCTADGDGRVPWSLGVPEGCQPYYIEAIHGDLLNTRKAFPGILDLLAMGETKLLPRQAPAPLEACPASMPRGFLPYHPDEAMLVRAGVGASLMPARDERVSGLPRLKVSVCHGDLRAARHPVVAGHYQGDTIVSAEAMLDRRLGGALTRNLRLGIYPGRIDTAEVFAKPESGPVGVVIGLDEVGSLTAARLGHAFGTGLLRLACSFPASSEQRLLTVSTLLIGTGAGGIPVKDCVTSLIEAANRVNALLADRQSSLARFTELEFLEIYEDRALQALRVIRDLSLDPGCDPMDFDCQLRTGQGGRTRASFEEAPGWWRRIKIEATEDDALRFSVLTDLARAEETILPTQIALVDGIVRSAIGSPSVSPKDLRALFELMVPNLLKARAGDRGNLQLVVDEAAAYPWEMMYGGDGKELRPLGLQAGLLRQLSSAAFRETARRSQSGRALVVGVPQPGGAFPPLPGVDSETASTRHALEQGNGTGMEVRRPDTPAPKDVISALFDGEYRVLHLAGHGVYKHPLRYRVGCDERVRHVSGMVLAAEKTSPDGTEKLVLLTPGEVHQMSSVPELVFINCCHLGAIEPGTSQDLSRHSTLAANLATEFIRIGVRAVVAAGWAVDDAAAACFAESFYGAMIRGSTFGDAVRRAREAAYDLNPGSTTWAAYQCYGDPAYRFREDGEATPPVVFVSPSEALCELRAIRDASDAELATGRGLSPMDRLDQITRNLRHEWLKRGDLRAALGAAYAELGNFRQALVHYGEAARCDDGGCTLHDLDQMTNLEIRLAARDARKARAAGLPESETQGRIRAAKKQIERGLSQLKRRARDYGEAPERCSLLGSGYKRLLTVDNQANGARQEMADWYRKAARLDGELDPCAAINWVGAVLLAHVPGTIPPTEASQLDKALAAIREKARALYRADPGFWNGVHEIDCDLLQALLDGPSATTEGKGKELAQRYIDLDNRHGGRRKFDSVTSHIEFLREHLLPGDGTQAIQDFLDVLLHAIG
ncbi:MAG: hypothetical protein H6R10_990 [Rhodocyclaceae bacterium]|nr:hypothetical protein [Rhodocyclaceae bacterium]